MKTKKIAFVVGDSVSEFDLYIEELRDQFEVMLFDDETKLTSYIKQNPGEIKLLVTDSIIVSGTSFSFNGKRKELIVNCAALLVAELEKVNYFRQGKVLVLTNWENFKEEIQKDPRIAGMYQCLQTSCQNFRDIVSAYY